MKDDAPRIAIRCNQSPALSAELFSSHSLMGKWNSIFHCRRSSAEAVLAPTRSSTVHTTRVSNLSEGNSLPWHHRERSWPRYSSIYRGFLSLWKFKVSLKLCSAIWGEGAQWNMEETCRGLFFLSPVSACKLQVLKWKFSSWMTKGTTEFSSSKHFILLITDLLLLKWY